MYLSLQNFQVNNRVVRILLVAMLIFCMVFCAFVFQLETAHAFALPFLLPIIGSILISAGLTFASQEAMEGASHSYYNSLSSDQRDELLASANNYFDNNMDFYETTSGIISSLASWINSLWDSSSSSMTFSVPSGFSLDGIDCSNIGYFMSKNYYLDGYTSAEGWIAYNKRLFGTPPLVGDWIGKQFYIQSSSSSSSRTISFKVENNKLYYGNVYNGVVSSWFLIDSIGLISDANYPKDTWFIINSSNYHYGGVVTTTMPTDSTVKPVTTYFPKEVVGSASGTTIFPNNTASKPLTPDIPINVPSDAGTLVGAPAGSTRGDATTGEGELTITGWLSKLWDGITSIPGTIAGAITGFFTPPVGMWDGFVDDAVKIMSPPGSVDFTNYVSSISIPDVTGNFKGKTLTFVDNQKLRDNVATWRQYIGAFLAFLLVLYNYNMFMKFMGYGSLSLTDSGRVRHEPVDINNLSGAGLPLPPPKGGR